MEQVKDAQASEDKAPNGLPVEHPGDTEKDGPSSSKSQDSKVDQKGAAVAVDKKQSNVPDPLSKNQPRKRMRIEKAMEHKRRKKMQQKETRLAKAIADGRDLDEERRVEEERRKSGEGHRKRQELWLEQSKNSDTTFRICLDCAWEDKMIPKEINSLALQIRYCYASNKRSTNPVHLTVANLSQTGTTRGHLEKVAGFPEQWRARNFNCSDKSLVDMHSDKPKDRLVYLTSDSECTLEHLDDTKTYVIGGIVDRNRLVRAAIDHAEGMSVTTAKLPIAQHLHLFSTKVLTCNHVFDILLRYRENGNDWKAAMMDVLPERKGAKEVQPSNDPEHDDCGKKPERYTEP